MDFPGRLGESEGMWTSPALRRSVAGVFAALLAATAFAGSASANETHGRTIPAHVFAPYFQAYLPDDPAALAAASGARYLNMAFLETDKPGSCQVYWNGVPTAPGAAPGYSDAIAKIRAMGGDVIPSFGGAYAASTGTEIADSCTDVNAVAAAYENVITTYDVTRLDMDIEGESLGNPAAIDRRNKALRLVQQWAERNHRVVQIVYTVGASPKGITSDGITILDNALANGTRVDLVNMMTFDYYDNKQHNMAADSRTAADGLVATLHGMYPAKTSSELWGMVSITEMIGLDDYGSGGETGPVENFTPVQAITTTAWAWARGIGQLSFWGLARDNGSCPGQHAEACSGVDQAPWQYSRTMGLFTHR